MLKVKRTMITNNNEGSKAVTQIQDGGDDVVIVYAKLLAVYLLFCVLHFVKCRKHMAANFKIYLARTYALACAFVNAYEHIHSYTHVHKHTHLLKFNAAPTPLDRWGPKKPEMSSIVHQYK